MSFGFLFDKLKFAAKKHLAASLQVYFLAQAKDVTDSLPEGPLLVIAPHPDDETLGCGALIRTYTSLGRAVRIIIVTDGSRASLPEPLAPSEIAAVRRKESLQAAKLLGVPSENVLFLPYPDSCVQENAAHIADDIASQLWLYQPALVVGPHGLDAHEDHRAVSCLLRKLQSEGKIPCPLFEYPLWFWPKEALRHLVSSALRQTHRKVSATAHLADKKQAVDAYVCQKSEEHWGHLEAYAIADRFRDYELFFEIVPNKEPPSSASHIL